MRRWPLGRVPNVDLEALPRAMLGLCCNRPLAAAVRSTGDSFAVTLDRTASNDQPTFAAPEQTHFYICISKHPFQNMSSFRM